MGAIFSMTARPYAPAPERAKLVLARMEKIPAEVARARTNLVPARVPRVWAEVGAERATSAKAFFSGQKAFLTTALPTEAARIQKTTADVVAAYETRPAAARDVAALAGELESGAIDALTFTSPSTVESFASSLAAAGGDVAALAGRAVVATIGPVTSERARALGLRVDVEAEPHTREGLVEALAQRFDGAALGQS
jgi:uroporphyrinogen III methyltransferase/synthase